MVSVRKDVVLKEGEGDDSIKLVCPESAALGKIWDALNAFRGVIFQQMQAQQDVENNESKEECVEECQEKESDSSPAA